MWSQFINRYFNGTEWVTENIYYKGDHSKFDSSDWRFTAVDKKRKELEFVKLIKSMKKEIEEFVIFWGYDRDGLAMFEGRDDLNTIDLNKARRFESFERAQTHVDVNYESVPHASIMPIKTAQQIKPLK